ncbi:MAG: alpha/beta hydrolase [Sphingopyxis sp.]
MMPLFSTAALLMMNPLAAISQAPVPVPIGWQDAPRARAGGMAGALARARRGGGAGMDGGNDSAERRSATPPTTTLAYGADPAQAVDFYAAPTGPTGPTPPTGPTAPNVAARQLPPLAIYVHGGGWRRGDRAMVAQKPEWFAAHGWAFASIGYRLLPDAPVETQAADVAAAIRQLRQNAARLGFDPNHILLMGHSAGAHLAALIGTDGAYLSADMAAVRGIILLDGAGYDVPRQMADASALTRRIYEPAFGTDAARQRALSPMTHIGGADVRQWLILYSQTRADSIRQSTDFAAALRGAGVAVQRLPVPGSHADINIGFGTPGYAGNSAIETMMRAVAAP